MFYDQLSLWPVIYCMTVSEEMTVNRGCLTIKEGRSHGWEDNRHALYYILITWTVSLDVAIQRRHWQPLWSIYELTVPWLNPWCEWCYVWRLTTPLGSMSPTLFEQWCEFFYDPQEPGKCKCCETGPMVFPIKLKDKFNLTSKNHFPRNKNQQYYPRFDHSINQTRKQLWFIAERKKKPTI